MGDFKKVPISKLAGRFKMLVSNTTFICILQPQEVHEIEDIYTPCKRYCHSDGAGYFGHDIAERLLRVLGEAPSAIQVRIAIALQVS